jgi:hypothetical protein
MPVVLRRTALTLAAIIMAALALMGVNRIASPGSHPAAIQLVPADTAFDNTMHTVHDTPHLGRRTPSPVTLSWHNQHIAGISASYPSATAKSSFTRETFDSHTARSHRLTSYESTLYFDHTGLLCTSDKTCGNSYASETYFVQVIHSRYTDACQALTAINGGVGRHPICRHDAHTGLLTVDFHDIYGGPGRTVWFNHRVYYIGSATLPALVGGRYFSRFANSIHFPTTKTSH